MGASQSTQNHVLSKPLTTMRKEKTKKEAEITRLIRNRATMASQVAKLRMNISSTDPRITKLNNEVKRLTLGIKEVRERM